MRDRTGVARDPAQHRVAVVEVEQPGHRGPLLGDEPVDPPSDRHVQGVAGVQEPQVGGADHRAQRVGDPGVRDRPQDAHVAQAAAGLLEVALQQEGELAVGLPAGGRHFAQGGQVTHRRPPPLVHGAGDEAVGDRLVAGDVPGVEQTEGDLDVVVGDGQRLGQRADGVVQAQPGVPDRVPDAGGELVHAGDAAVQQDQVEVAVRGALPAAETADGDERDTGRGVGREQRAQPGVDGVRPRRPRGVADARYDDRAGGGLLIRHRPPRHGCY